MGEITAISWADSTFNCWIGCQKVGPGCDFCYAEALNERFADGANWGPGAPRRRTTEANWRKPLQWNGNAEKFMAQHGRRQRVFCASMADVFDNEAPQEWREDLWDLIDATPNLDWLIVTKRVSNVEKMMPDRWRENWPAHVWLLITTVNQDEVDRDAPRLLHLKRAHRIRIVGLSIEPMLGPINLRSVAPDDGYGWNVLAGYIHDMGVPTADAGRLDWIICGGESGREARPMHPDWARGLRDQCAKAKVAFHLKQITDGGRKLPIAEWPEDLRIQEFPA